MDNTVVNSEITMDELMSNIINTLDSIETSTTNIFIIKKCNIVDIKLEEIRARKYSMVETVESICNSIINNDISDMKGVLNQTEEMYVKYDEMETMITQIPQLYLPL